MTRLPFFHKVFSLFIISLLIAYWALTFFFELPENYLNVNRMKENTVFNFFFFQRWAFFAPPPRSNDRLYFQFFNTKGEFVSEFEVLEAINTEKQRKAPFNRKEDVLDYLLSNTVNSIRDNLLDLQNIVNYQKKYEKKEISDSVILNTKLKMIEASPEFKSLLNYARLIVFEKGIKSENLKVQIRISEIEIPQFADRNKNDRQEKTILISNLQNL